MTGRKKYLRFVTFLPAIILVGGFVGFRAGAFELFPKPQPQSDSPTAEEDNFLPGSNRIHIMPPPTGSAPQPAPEEPTYIGGSKYIVLVKPGQGSAPTVPTVPAAPTAPAAPTPPQP